MRKQFLWLYGVIVGLVIREATVKVVPFVTNPQTTLGWTTLFFLARFAVLILMVVRFYLGAAVVMNSNADSNASAASEAVPLLSGLAHFVLFFAWASTINLEPSHLYQNLSEFEIFMLLVLLYDVAWWLMSSGRRFKKMNVWTVVNLITAISCFALHIVLYSFTPRLRLVECIVFLPVIAVSLVDMSEIFTQRELFGKWFANLST